MNRSLVAAGVLALGITAIHVVAGHDSPLLPMLAAPFDETAKRTMYAVWHMASADLLLSGVGLIAAGRAPERFAARGVLPAFVALHYVVWSGVFVVIALGSQIDHALVALPQWLLMLPVAVLATIGAAQVAARGAP